MTEFGDEIIQSGYEPAGDKCPGDGHSYGLIGMSGCGNSTLARLLAVLEPPTTGGEHFGGDSAAKLKERDRRAFHRLVQMVFQDPYAKALLASTPAIDPDMARGPAQIKGAIPNAANMPTGCRFHPRCPVAQLVCAETALPMMFVM